MDKDKKKIIAGAGILGGAGLLYLLLRRGKAAPPPPPGKATLWGIASDASSGQAISGIQVALDSLTVTTGANGRYEFTNIEPSTYSLSFTDPLGRYEPLTV